MLAEASKFNSFAIKERTGEASGLADPICCTNFAHQHHGMNEDRRWRCPAALTGTGHATIATENDGHAGGGRRSWIPNHLPSAHTTVDRRGRRRAVPYRGALAQ